MATYDLNENETAYRVAQFTPRLSWIQFYVTAVLLGIIILWTIIGNVFVVAAIILEKTLKCVSNYLILSLAVADLMVASLVMPISAIKEVSSSWWLGIELCDLWTCFDVLSCTASILHLVVIAMDRYWAVTDIKYLHRRTPRRIMLMIGVVWTISVIISVPSRFHAHRNHSEWIRVVVNGSCIINNSMSYTIFSNLGAFYLPMVFMSIIYLKIYLFARSRIRCKRRKLRQHNHNLSTISCTENKQKTPPETHNLCVCTFIENKHIDQNDTNFDTLSQYPLVIMNNKSHEWFDRYMNQLEFADQNTDDSNNTQEATTIVNTSFNPCSTEKENGFMENSMELKPKELDEFLTKECKKPMEDFANQSAIQAECNSTNAFALNRDKIEQKRERKAARTLAIITGCFIICWLPFGCNNVARAFCQSEMCQSDLFDSLCLWLGYVNSGLNPVIYTVFSPDFRNAFRKILLGIYRSHRYFK